MIPLQKTLRFEYTFSYNLREDVKLSLMIVLKNAQ